ncbi:MAG: N-acetylmuramoyl-L-alanine amidase [Alphaproteobacteria bacterium]|nr:N-acetylmuramoyl-L-alanine amidase [Alphaproteobacteria bacterium]
MIVALSVMGLTPAAARAELSALARIDAGQSAIVDKGQGAEITLSLSQSVPWRVFVLDNPRRAVLDFSDVLWPQAVKEDAAAIEAVRMGAFQPGWSRMVLDLAEPMVVGTAAMATGAEDGRATLRVTLRPVSESEFALSAGAPQSARFRLQEPRLPRAPADDEDGRLHVMLDPGHGGIDPGAEAGGLQEAALMLTFARELREVLLRSGGFEVSMTRDGDVFVPLETRITLARAAGADVFVSLHADALPEDAGQASGATVYTLSDEASDLASQRLAERHDQSDLLAGVDLTGQGDEIALILMELARRETEPRVDNLADALVGGIRDATGPVNSRPRRSAGFSVLKAPDIPSVLVELGFLSSARDRAKLADPEWRAKAAEGIRDGLRLWVQEDAIRAQLVRQ